MSNPVKVGIFSLVTLVIFILGFYFLRGIDIFSRKKSFYAVYSRVDGLYKSNLVEIDGFPIGRVGDMDRNPATGEIVVRIDLEKEINIPKSDSTMAYLFSTDLFGTKKIKLVFGQSDEYYNDGDTIHTYFKKDLTEQVGAQIDPIITDVRHIIPKLDTTISGIQALFDKNNAQGIYTTLSEVNGALAKISQILASNEANLQLTIKNLQSITGNFEKNGENLTKIIKNTSAVTDSLQQANLKQTIENLNQTINQLNSVVADINAGKGTLGKVVKGDSLYNNIDSTISSLQVLLKDVKARPYRYVNINVFGGKKKEERIEKKYNESGK